MAHDVTSDHRPSCVGGRRHNVLARLLQSFLARDFQDVAPVGHSGTITDSIHEQNQDPTGGALEPNQWNVSSPISIAPATQEKLGSA